MNLHVVDIVIIVAYLLSTVLIGYWVSHRASQSMQAYFLGGNKMPWYVLGISNASGMFDISGTMLLVYWMFIYGLKSVWIPWLWPTFNQIFLMVYLSAWLRRSKVMTGAEWIKTRFGAGRGAQLSHLIVVIYAFVSIIGFFSYGFKGIGKFAATFLPWHLSPNEYALILIAITAIYVIKGGMISVVITEVVQFFILAIASFAVGIIAMMKVAPDTLHRWVPAGWDNLFFGWHLNLDWSTLLPSASDDDCQRRLRPLRLLRHDAVLQGRADLGRRSRAQLRYAARALGQNSARSLHDERLGQRRAHLSALLSDHRAHRSGSRLLQRQHPGHGPQHGLRAGAALCAGPFRSRRPAGIPDRRPAGRLHVQLRGHRERRAALLRQRHLQALHQSQRGAQNLCPPQLSRLLCRGGDRRPHRLERHLGQLGGGVDRLRPVGRLHRLQRPQVVLVAL